jgi:hypothetical protein
MTQISARRLIPTSAIGLVALAYLAFLLLIGVQQLVLDSSVQLGELAGRAIVGLLLSVVALGSICSVARATWQLSRRSEIGDSVLGIVLSLPLLLLLVMAIQRVLL